MYPFVLVDVRLLREPLRTVVTLVGPVLQVDPVVLLQSATRLEPLSALRALVNPDKTALFHVTSQL